jgi:hypothetical protein
MSSVDAFRSIWATPRFVYAAGDLGVTQRVVRNVPWSCRATETDCNDDVDNNCDGVVDACP